MIGDINLLGKARIAQTEAQFYYDECCKIDEHCLRLSEEAPDMKIFDILYEYWISINIDLSSFLIAA